VKTSNPAMDVKLNKTSESKITKIIIIISHEYTPQYSVNE
jgi:hypothetical protein